MRPIKSVTDLLKELNETDETEYLEAKTCDSKVGKSVYESICAFSNEPDLDGGVILLGIEKEDSLFPTYKAVGVKDPDKLSSDIASACSTMFNIPIRVNITAEKIGKATVLKIIVQELPKASKPLYFKATGLPKGAYRRIGPTDIKCTDEDMSVFFQGKANAAFDEQIIRDSSWNDIDPAAVKAYKDARAETNPHSETLTWSSKDLLQALGAIRYDGDAIRLTTTGLIVFGTTTALRRLAPAHRVDYIRISGNHWVDDIENPFQSTDMRGPLMLLIGRVIAAIADDLPKAFRLDSLSTGQRTETPVIPLRVIREAVVNSLMHRTYQIDAPVQILRFSNRILIKNPGYSLKSQDRFDESGSIIRNPHIAEILHETRYAETKGSGIRVMRQKMEQSGLAVPTFDSDRDTDQFSATFLFHHFLDENDIEWLAKFKDVDLTEDQIRALIFVREVGAISNSVYRSITHTDTLTASKSLRKLRSIEILKEEGSGTKTTYIPGSEMLKRLSIHAKSSTIHVTTANMDGDILTSYEGMPFTLKRDVVSARLSKRLSVEKAMLLIEQLCSWQPLSLAELAGILERTTTHLSQKYITPMVAEGRITYTIPEMPQHPNQKYKSNLPKK